ncbi:hypothetical protein B0H34DRAFT_674049 [Crassisporium funariophilum]|nr:hypothetical protein B0H34DRAFT_674049 [Crassisporium funariophilum]
MPPELFGIESSFKMLLIGRRPSKKQKKNLTGLWNQSLVSSTPSGASTGRSSSSASGLEQQLTVTPESFQVIFDSTRVDWEKEEEAPTDSDVDDEMGLDTWDDKDLAETLAEMTRKAADKDVCANKYIKGPDVMSKSACTQHCHRKAWAGPPPTSNFG